MLREATGRHNHKVKKDNDGAEKQASQRQAHLAFHFFALACLRFLELTTQTHAHMPPNGMWRELSLLCVVPYPLCFRTTTFIICLVFPTQK